MDAVKKFLFEDKATFFICGSTSMDNDLKNLFVNVFKEAGFKPYAALTKVKELQNAKRIVKEVYG